MTDAETPEQTPAAAPVAAAAPANAGDTPPDRLSVNPKSPHFDMEVLKRGIGIRFKDRVRTDVEEYSISEGWVRVAAGKSRDRYGNPLTIKLSGPVEAWFEDVAKQD
jgi:hypothetical protein